MFLGVLLLLVFLPAAIFAIVILLAARVLQKPGMAMVLLQVLPVLGRKQAQNPQHPGHRNLRQ
jgi:hypothetical protein